MQTAKILLCSILIFVAHATYDWFTNQPQETGAQVPPEKLTSLSFAPYWKGYSPLEEKFPLQQHIDDDLRLLADKTYGIRTYSSRGGMEPTPELARKYGISMILGGWLGNNHQENQKEIEVLIKSANANPDVVKRVIVGNEVLLRGDMDVKRLIAYIREVKHAIKQPVSYGDVWSMYIKYPKLMKEVDFITIHILPYWEDEPIAVEHAPEHLEKIVKLIEDKAHSIAPGKPILIGESGWPSAGRQRGLAVPGVVNEAKYLSSMIQVAKLHGFDYNIVEAFNQPWKSKFEGVVGANWGMISADRKPIFSLSNPVSKNPDWLNNLAVVTLLWLPIVAGYFKTLKFVSLPRLLVFMSLALLMGDSLVSLADFLWHTSYNAIQRSYTVSIVVANAAIGIMLIHRCHDMLTDKAGVKRLARWLRYGYLLFILLALYKTYGLAVNGRFLSFPNEQFAIPVLGVAGMLICQWLNQGKLNGDLLALDRLTGWRLHSRGDRMVAYFLSLAMLAMVAGETKAFMDGGDFILAHPGFFEGLPFALGYTLKNHQLTIWLANLFILSIPFWTNTGREAENRQGL